MARKNQWEQFANNFSTFYDLGNKVQTGLGAKKIMADEVETIQAADAGNSPHAAGQGIGSGTQYKYDGKMYKEEITADQLTGLRNKRLSDNMVKFGDSEGAMKFNLSNAELKAANSKSRLDDATFDDNVLAAKLANDVTAKGLELTQAQINEYKALTPLKAKKYLADIASTKQSTKVSQTKLPLEVRQLMAKLNVDEQTAKEFLSEESTELRVQSRTNLGKTQTNKATELDQEAKIQAGTYENNLAQAIYESGEAKTMAGARVLAANRNLEGNKTLSSFATEMQEGNALHVDNFADASAHAKAQQDYLRKYWNGDKAVGELIKTIGADELAAITAEGSLMMAKVNNVFQGKSQNSAKDELIKLIDGQDGITGNMRWDTKDGKVQLIETDGDGEETIIEGTSWNNFKQVFYGEFTPLKSLEIAKSNADTQLVSAQAAKAESEALEAPRNYDAEKWQGMITQFMSSTTYLAAAAEGEPQRLKALMDFKAEFSSGGGLAVPSDVVVTLNPET